MRRLIYSAFVIARRDYIATVFSRTFLIFLIGPLLPIVFGVGITTLTLSDDKPTSPPSVIAVAGAHDGSALLAARERLAARLTNGRMPPLKVVAPPADPNRLIDSGDQPAAVLSGDLAHPVLSGPEARALAGRVALIIDQARQIQLLDDRMPALVRLTVQQASRAAPHRSESLRGFARGAQTGLFFLIVILAGMLMTNLVEEKSNKVIEVLAAAVPVDAIFAGKLAGMLAVSLTGIAGWASMAAVAVITLVHPGVIPPPAVGWPIFIALAALYFSTLYLLVGAVFLGVGAQAASVREVQTLSMPLTLAQLLVYGLASTGLAHPGGTLGMAAAIFPWSSPYTMLARAAEEPALWPHPIALLWQIAWLIVVIRLSGRLFRLTVLKSGGLRARRT
jgi:ABC-2 type transport system permease protein